MQKTNIEWADYVWNPTTGCSKVSTGCKNCYAEIIAKRFWGDRPFTDVQCHYDRLDQPQRVKRGGLVFVDSMSDLFHDDVSHNFINKVFETMHLAYWHTFIILTKRPIRMCTYIQTNYKPGRTCILPNVWLGVSVENRETIHQRIPLLLHTPAAKHIVSVEPMLESLYLQRLPEYIPKLDWVICGGESGKGARPHPSFEDVQYLKDQCVEAGVPFFLKQMWGQKMPELDGRVWDQIPEGE